MDLVKNWQFFHPLIIGAIGQENVFEYIRERQKAFPDNKNNKLKNQKFGILPKVLVHGFR